MKQALLYGPKDVRIESVDVPEIGPGEVLVRIKAALTCGTDAKVYTRGGHPRMIKPPAPFGHEFSGLVAKAGEGVEGFCEGMRVAAANSAPCGVCFWCKKAQPNLCEDLLFINGAYGEYIKLPASIVRQNLLKIPSGLSFSEAALVEPLACVIHGIEEADIGLGDTVAINGAGPIGLLFLQLTKLKGSKVIVSDAEDERLTLAKKLGADEIIDVSGTENQVKAVREKTHGGRGVDIAIEAVGLPATWELTINMVRKGGLCLLFGGCAPGTKISLDTQTFHYNELTLKGVFHHTPDCVERALEILSLGRINSKALITGQLPLEELPKALDLMLAHKGVKTAVIP